MKRRNIARVMAILLLTVFSVPALAAATDGEDTDALMVDAKVVEVNDHRISVIARTGVEHVIAIDGSDTKVTRKGKRVSLKDLREGDVVTVELDAHKPLKFARNIVISAQPGGTLASNQH